MQIRVACHAGYRAEEEPRALYLGERRVEAAAVLDRWLDPRMRYFKVQAEDGAVYILRHDELADAWEIVWFTAEI
jgi:hypothetical protein